MRVVLELTQREADELLRADFTATKWASPLGGFKVLPRDLESAKYKIDRAIVAASREIGA
jgi:hypothetical protein